MVGTDPQGHNPPLRVVKQCKHQQVTRCIDCVDFRGIFEYLTYSSCRSTWLALITLESTESK
jgi:hypothetical protein